MPWSEEEFRRALDDAAEQVRPDPGALGMLRARAHRRERVRVAGYAFAGLAAAAGLIAIGFALRPATHRPDVELAGPGPATRINTLSAPPVVREDADGGSILPEISGDGRSVVFMSDSTALVDGDTNDVSDTFVRDLATGRLERVSVSSTGEQGNAPSLSGSISGDGRFVAFRSEATNLVRGDTNGRSDIFLRDRTEGTTIRISVASDGTQANGESDSAAISADGRFVAFRSAASNLVSGDTNGLPDIFVYDVTRQTVSRLSISSSGAQSNGDSRNPAISADGSRVVYSSIASSLARGDTNRTWDVFMRDTVTHTTQIVSVSTDGREGNLASVFPSISPDGSVVAFVSSATNLVSGDTNRARDVFVRYLVDGGLTQIVSSGGVGVPANGASLSASLCDRGRYVAFSSNASNLVPDDVNQHRDVFVASLQPDGGVTLISRSSSGASSDGDSGGPSMSGDCRYVAFQSYATTLAAGDGNGVIDVYAVDFFNHTTTRVSAPPSR